MVIFILSKYSTPKDQTMDNQQNPLKQFFRRPSLYIKLPSDGKFYPQNAIKIPESGELPIYPMTTIDEITSQTPDALYNGTAIVDIIKSCVPAITNPWEVPSIDLDPLIVAIRVATVGQEMDIDTKCPNCNEETRFGVDLLGILSQFKAGDYSTPLVLGDMSFTFRPVSYKTVNKSNMMQFDIQREINTLNNLPVEAREAASGKLIKKMHELGMQVISESISEVKTPVGIVTDKKFIFEYLMNCDRAIYESIKAAIGKLRESTEVKPLDIECPHCKHKYPEPFMLNISDFFD